jgi:hypothetical protein
MLIEERDLIDKHLAEQRVKQAEISKAEATLQERSALVSTTLHNLQVSGGALFSYCTSK